MGNAKALLQAAGDRLPQLAPGIAVFFVAASLVAVLTRIWSTHNALSKLPLVGKEFGGTRERRSAFMEHAKELYYEGYRKFKNGVFRITTASKYPTVVVGTGFLDELKRLPDSVINMDAALNDMFHGKWTNITDGNTILPITIKTNLTPALNRLNPTIAGEVQESFRRELPACEEWTAVNINQKLLRIVAMVSGRAFIGPELCRSEEYIHSAINYTVDCNKARNAISKIPVWLRTFKVPNLPEVRQLQSHRQAARAFLRPIVEARRKAGKEKADDMLQWIIDQFEAKNGEISTEELVNAQLTASFAAIHTTTIVTTSVIYTLVTMPDLVEELRDEIRTVLAQHDNTFTSAALQGMKKMDSVLKETMRFYPGSYGSFHRLALKPFTLSNGQVIPANTLIEVSTAAVNSDPDVYENADKFDPLRYYRMREAARGKGAAEEAAQNQFASVSHNNLLWGYGRRACPGRFFASNEIKMILANLLLTYDIKSTDPNNIRYPNIPVGSEIYPDPDREIMIRKIQA